VIEIIFDYFIPDIPFSSPDFSWKQRDADGGYTKRHLASLGLISHAWINPTRRILYRTIVPSRLLWATITTYPHVRNYIRHIHLIRLEKKYCFVPPLPITEQCRELLPNCTLLVRVGGPGFELYRVPETVVSSDFISYLMIYPSSPDYYSTALWRTGFRSWTRLEVLQISGNPNWFSYDDGFREDEVYLPSLRVLKCRTLRNSPIPIPPITPNSIHTLCFVNCNLEEAAVINLIRRHSSSLRRLYIADTSFVSDSALGHTLVTALSHLQSLESLVIHNMGVHSPETILLRLPRSLISVSVTIPAREPVPWLTFYNFLCARGTDSTLRDVEIIIMSAKAQTRIDKNWIKTAQGNEQPGLRLLFLKSGAQLDLPNWACMGDPNF
jgi:hypothetical protein